MRFETVTLPAYYASALVNGDTSGLTGEGKEQLERIYKWLDGGSVVDVARDDDGDAVEPSFTWHFDQYGGECKGGEVLDYTVAYKD